jgi:5-methylcytosine-specific restriction protein A
MKEGRYVKATDVDHIKPHRGDNVLFWDQSNWQSLCHRHHSVKTRNEDHTPEYKY